LRRPGSNGFSSAAPPLGASSSLPPQRSVAGPMRDTSRAAHHERPDRELLGIRTNERLGSSQPIIHSPDGEAGRHPELCPALKVILLLVVALWGGDAPTGAFHPYLGRVEAGVVRGASWMLTRLAHGISPTQPQRRRLETPGSSRPRPGTPLETDRRSRRSSTEPAPRRPWPRLSQPPDGGTRR
jgi:hypothetical protein